MFIGRDYHRTEADDFKLNVEPLLTSQYEATPVMGGKATSEVQHVEGLIGWHIKPRYE